MCDASSVEKTRLAESWKKLLQDNLTTFPETIPLNTKWFSKKKKNFSFIRAEDVYMAVCVYVCVRGKGTVCVCMCVSHFSGNGTDVRMTKVKVISRDDLCRPAVLCLDLWLYERR